MACCFSSEDSDRLHDFVPYTDELNESEQNENSRKRQRTDLFFLYFMGLFFLGLFGLMIYCISIGDINRILVGYDDCGNICGVNNVRTMNDPTCFGANYTSKPYHRVLGNGAECVDDCEKYGEYVKFGKCKREQSGNQDPVLRLMEEDLRNNLGLICLSIMFSLIMVAINVLLLRFYPGIFLKSILIIGVLCCIIVCVILWICVAMNSDDPDTQIVFKSVAIILTIFSGIVFLIGFVIRKRIRMVIALFKETSKAVGGVPLILLQPIATLAAFLVLCFIILLLYPIIFSIGDLTWDPTTGNYIYVLNNVAVVAAVYLAIGFIWLVYFFIGCQHMIIGGSIASWYFLRDKTRLYSPIYNSARNLVRYHLGSVAFGSLIMLMLAIIKRIIERIEQKMRQNRCSCCIICFSCVFDRLAEFIKYFSKLSYIMTAMHGVSFCRGGKEANRLLVNNFVSTLCANSVTSFMFFVMQLILFLTVFGISFLMMNKPGVNYPAFPAFIAALIGSTLFHIFLVVYDTAIATVFLCFCEDQEQNDGTLKPYYMSRDLAMFVENTKLQFIH